MVLEMTVVVLGLVPGIILMVLGMIPMVLEAGSTAVYSGSGDCL